MAATKALMTHYSEADLLETYYTQPGESMPVMMHLAGCSDCAARYERLERKLHDLSSCHTAEKPESFWARQRLAILRRMEPRRRFVSARLAAAVVLAFSLGGLAVYTTRDAPPAAEVQVSVPDDPWQSEELQDYAGVVQWESWVEGEAKL